MKTNGATQPNQPRHEYTADEAEAIMERAFGPESETQPNQTGEMVCPHDEGFEFQDPGPFSDDIVLKICKKCRQDVLAPSAPPTEPRKFNDNYSEAAAFAGIAFSQAVQFDSYMEYLLGRGPAPGFAKDWLEPSAPPTLLDGYMKDPTFAAEFHEEKKALDAESPTFAYSPDTEQLVARLRLAAQRAGGDKWSYDGQLFILAADGQIVAEPRGYGRGMHLNFAEFIAAASPENILKLLDHIKPAAPPADKPTFAEEDDADCEGCNREDCKGCAYNAAHPPPDFVTKAGTRVFIPNTDKPTFAYSLAMYLTRNGQQGNAPELQKGIEQFLKDKGEER